MAGMAFGIIILKEKIIMKKTSTLIIAIILTASIYAYPIQSALSISATITNNMYVLIDGNKYKASSNELLVNDIVPGYHRVQVYQQKMGVRNNPFSSNQLLYSSNILVKPQYHVDIVINRFGKAFIDEQLLDINCTNTDINYGQNDNHWGNNNQWNNDNNNWNNNNWNSNINRTMADATFEQFVQTLRNESFDNTKMNMAKQILVNNFFTTAQIKAVMQQFTFENNKLDIAKYAYRYTVDKSNYFALANEFTFSNNKEALIRHIQNNR